MQQITSVKNPLVSQYKKLHQAKGCRDLKSFLLEGEHLVFEAIELQIPLLNILVSSNAQNYINRLMKLGLSFQIASPHVIEACCQTKTPQGIIAQSNLPLETIKDLPERILLCDGLQDPGNLGTLIRTAEAAGFGCVMTYQCADAFVPKTVRATMGSILRLPVHATDDPISFITQLKKDGYECIAAALDGEDFFKRSHNSSKVVLVVGSEAHGIRNEILEHCTVYRLPMAGKVESLNAAIAGSIMMYNLFQDKNER